MVDTKKEQEREELHRAIWAIKISIAFFGVELSLICTDPRQHPLAGVYYAYSSTLFCLFFFWLLSAVCSCPLISPMTCCIFSAPK